MKAAGAFRKINNDVLAVAIKKDIGVNNARVEVIAYERGVATISFEYDYGDIILHFKKNIKIKSANETCEECIKMRGGYFEAMVQLRGDTYLVSKMVEKIKRYVEKNGTFVSKVETVSKGYDIYIGDKKVVNAFMSLYELKPTRSYDLYGLQRGKKVYRNIYAVRL